MPNQTDVQKLIQGLAPGAVNNGNPNTVYNTPGTVMRGTPSVPPPTTDATGNWVLNNLPKPAVMGPPNIQLPQVTPSSALGSWTAPHDPAALNLPQWKMMPFGQGTTQPPGTTPPPTTPPPTDTGGNTPPTPSTGGPTPPNVGTPDPLADFGGFDNEGRWHPGQGALNMFGDNALFSQSFSIYDPAFKKIWGLDSVPPEVKSKITDGNGQIDEAKTESFFSDLFSKGSLLNALDKVTEIFPFLNGVDWYNSDTGQINVVSSVMQVVANALGIGPLFRLFMKAFNNKKLEEAVPLGAGCVVVDAIIHEYGRAGDVAVGDTLKVIDPVTFELEDGAVSYSEAKLQPCVRITTKSGVELECSKSAPISDDTGEQVLAEHLLGVNVPVSKHGLIEFETVMSVEDIGERLVQHITCENNFFLAGKKKGLYLLHHNAKKVEGLNPFKVGNLGHGSNPSGFGWGGNFNWGSGVVNVGPLENIK